jgi:hypothetical protein
MKKTRSTLLAPLCGICLALPSLLRAEEGGSGHYANTGNYEVGRLAHSGKNFGTVEPTLGLKTAPGKHSVVVSTTLKAPKPGAPADIVLTVDGKEVAVDQGGGSKQNNARTKQTS